MESSAVPLKSYLTEAKCTILPVASITLAVIVWSKSLNPSHFRVTYSPSLGLDQAANFPY
jgi:hypothetical protein